MRGSLWIVSYAVLSATVVWLGLAVLFLFRERIVVREAGPWPSSTLRPGAPLPPIGRSDSDDLRVGKDTIIVAASADAPTTFALLVAAHHFGEEVGLPTSGIIVDRQGGAAPPWVDDLPDPLAHELRFVSPRDLAAWNLDRLPVTLVVRGGRLRHVVPGPMTARQLRDHLWVFCAGQVGSHSEGGGRHA
ncbi:MAG TPA: hypothetical protein VNP94_00055 [Actinomycetota bacterium]|nr:hypothetical protein [Actinomycetota bacterium]